MSLQAGRAGELSRGVRLPRSMGAGRSRLLWISLLFACQIAARHDLPAGTRLKLRLSNPVGSRESKPGAAVEAFLTSPATSAEGHTLLPSGTRLCGVVTRVRRVGLGLIHETARLELEFTVVTTPAGVPLPVRARLVDVENARERVGREGSIHGKRPTGSLAYRSSRYLTALLLHGVPPLPIRWIVRSALAHVPDPEIYYPAGSDLTVELTDPLALEAIPDEPAAPPTLSPGQRDGIMEMMRRLPSRTSAPRQRGESDPVNLLLIGSREEVESAFTSAGWVGADPVTVRSALKSIRAAAAEDGYRQAPVSVVLWRDAPPDMVWQKSLNTVAKRQHLRAWRCPETWEGRDLWVAAAHRDVGYAFFRPGQKVSHRIEPEIDLARAKVLDDLVLTGLVAGYEWLERPEVPTEARNASGDRVATDGRLAAVVLQGGPGRALPSEGAAGPPRGSFLYRVARRQILSIRNDLVRGNLYWRSYEGLRWLVSAVLRRRNRVAPVRAQDAKAAEGSPGKRTGP